MSRKAKRIRLPYPGGSRSRIVDESNWQSGDGGIAYFIGEDNESINIEERYCVE